jgi:hypothetical protein
MTVHTSTSNSVVTVKRYFFICDSPSGLRDQSRRNGGRQNQGVPIVKNKLNHGFKFLVILVSISLVPLKIKFSELLRCFNQFFAQLDPSRCVVIRSPIKLVKISQKQIASNQ